MSTPSMARLCWAIMLLALLASRPAVADQQDDEAAIRKSSTTYVEAFNRQDAGTLAALWSPSAVYVNRVTGEEVTGRGEIEKALTSLFAESGDSKLEVEVTSVKFTTSAALVASCTLRSKKVIRGRTRIGGQSRY